MFRILHEQEPLPVPTSLCGFILGNLSICITVWALPWSLISLKSAVLMLAVVFSTYLAIRKTFPFILCCFSSYLSPHEQHFRNYLPNLTSAYLLGSGFGLGWCLYFASAELQIPRLLWPFALYLVFLSFFHWSEFFFSALTHPSRVSVELYMLDHSPEYGVAALASVVEYCLESYFWPTKSASFLLFNILGLIMCIVGESIRKIAILTAAESFSHFVEYTLRQEHQLVTTGIYAWFRHPAYVGWFYWSWGTQLLLMNPLCAIAYPIAAYRFFSDRVFLEESTLVTFFGQAYYEYQAKVGTGLPFIYGYIPVDRQQ